MGQINVAIIGVGNCASALVQGVNKYKEAEGDKQIPGIMHNELGGYSVGDLNIVAAFDVDEDKVGKFFSGISDQYGEDVGMARAGFSQSMQSYPYILL